MAARKVATFLGHNSSLATNCARSRMSWGGGSKYVGVFTAVGDDDEGLGSSGSYLLFRVLSGNDRDQFAPRRHLLADATRERCICRCNV
jgi:hypothetical protein